MPVSVSAGAFTYYNAYNQARTAAFPAGSSERRGDTVVGNDVWIGGDAMIMPGVWAGTPTDLERTARKAGLLD